MYTIRQILGTTLRLTMSGVKYKESAENSTKSLQAQIVELGKSAKDGIDFISKRSELLRAASVEELRKLQKLAEQGRAGKGEYNKNLLEDIKKALDTKAPIVPTPPTESAKVAGVNPETQPKLVDEQKLAIEAVVVAHDKAEKVIKIESKDKQVKVMDDVVKTGSQSKKEDFKDESLKIEYTKDGKLTRESMIGLLSDLDGMSGVERTNRGWLRRTLFGGGDQKEVIGEQQIKNILASKSEGELDAIYKRITGNDVGLPWKMERKTLKEGEKYQGSIYDYDHKDRAKVTRFQEELVAQADVMADTMSIILSDDKARSGLIAVLEGKTGELQTALNNTANQKVFKELLAKSGVLNRDPQFIEKMASALLRIGILVPFSILSGGVLGGYIEQTKISTEKGKLSRDSMNLTAKAGVGEEASVAASLDVVGARLEGNWNDPEQRIANRLASVTESKDKKKAISDLVAKINSEVAPKSGEKPTDASRKVVELGNAFVVAQSKLHGLPESQAKSDAIAQNTLTYLSKVEKARGFEFKGVFAAATLSGWMVGLAGVATDTSANFDGLKSNAATIEAASLAPKSLTEDGVNEYLKLAGIEKNTAGNYVVEGKEIVLNPNQQIQWHFTRIYTDRNSETTATYQIVSGSRKVTSDVVTKFTNPEARNAYIEKNSKEVATLMKDLRKNVAGFTRFEELASSGQYDKALDTISKLTQSNGKLILEIGNLDTNAKKKAFIDMLLAKTSGSDASRKLGNEILAGTQNLEAVKEYFSRIAPAFTRQYGVDAMKQFDAIAKNGLSQKDIKTIGDYAKNGFNAMVAYNQINAGKGFVKIDAVDHKNAQIIGTPAEVTGADADKIRDIAKGNITPAQVAAFKKENPTAVTGFTDKVVKDMMVSGKVSSYLSFEPDAACFNLGFIVEPGNGTKTIEGKPGIANSTLSEGSIVGVPESGITSAGIGAGADWNKPKEPPKEPTPEPPKEPTPTTPDKPKPPKPSKPTPPSNETIPEAPVTPPPTPPPDLPVNPTPKD